MTSPLFRQWRRTVYDLKRRYGQALSLCQTVDTVNLDTGIKTSTVTTVNVKRGVFLPSEDTRIFSRMKTDTSRSQFFAYGDMFDVRDRVLLVDRRDIPTTFTIDLNMYVLFNGARLEVAGIEEFEEAECLLLKLKKLDGAVVNTNQASPTP